MSKRLTTHFRFREWVSRLSILVDRDEWLNDVPRSEVKLLEVQELTKKEEHYWCILEHRGKQYRTPVKINLLEEIKRTGGQRHFRTPICPECSRDLLYNYDKKWYYCQACKNAWIKVPGGKK